MTTSYKHRFEKLNKDHKVLTKEVKVLVNHLLRVRKKCRDNNLWLMASCNPHVAMSDEQQQGPMVSKLYELAGKLKEKL